MVSATFRAPLRVWLLLVLVVPLLLGTMVPVALFVDPAPQRAVAAVLVLAVVCLLGVVVPALTSGAGRGQGIVTFGREVVVEGAWSVELAFRAVLLVAPLLSAVVAWAVVGGYPDNARSGPFNDLGKLTVLFLVPFIAFPTTFRLLAGRLPRRRLVLGADGLTERGWRGERALRWREIEAVEVDPRSRAILLVTAEEDVVLAWTYYRVDPAWLYDELSRRAGRAAP